MFRARFVVVSSAALVWTVLILAPQGAALPTAVDAPDGLASLLPDLGSLPEVPEPRPPSLTTFYNGNMLLYTNPDALDDGGRVLYASGPAGTYVSVDRMVGGTDGVKVTAGPFMQASYAQANDTENDTWSSVAMSVGNNVWLVAALDPENLEHYAILGWYVWPSAGTVGEENLDPWAVVCAAVACAFAS